MAATLKTCPTARIALPTDTFSLCELHFSAGSVFPRSGRMSPRSGYIPRLGTGTKARHQHASTQLAGIFARPVRPGLRPGLPASHPRPCPPAPCGPPVPGRSSRRLPPGALTAPPAGRRRWRRRRAPPWYHRACGGLAPPVDVRRYEPPVASAEPPMWKAPASPGVRLAVPSLRARRRRTVPADWRRRSGTRHALPSIPPARPEVARGDARP